MLGMSFDKWDMTNKCLLRYDIKEQKYLDYLNDPNTLFLNGDPIKTFVPMLEAGKEFNYTQEDLLKLAEGNYPNGSPAEGIVIRSLDQSISFKVVSNKFLLKYSEH
jgi:hypothetical protein